MAYTPVFIEGFDKYPTGSMENTMFPLDSRYANRSNSILDDCFVSEMPYDGVAAPYSGAKCFHTGSEYLKWLRAEWGQSLTNFHVGARVAFVNSLSTSSYDSGINLGYAGTINRDTGPIAIKRVLDTGFEIVYPGGLQSVTHPIDATHLYKLDLYVKQDPTNGELAFWIDSQLQFHVTGIDTGDTPYSNFLWSRNGDSTAGSWVAAMNCVIVGECDSVDDAMVTEFYVPNVPVVSNGTITGFETGADYTDVEDAPHDGDATTIVANSTTSKATFGLGGIPTLPITAVPKAVSVVVASKRLVGGDAIQQKAVLESGGFETVGDPEEVSLDQYTGATVVAPVDPADGLPWTQAKLDAATVGVELQPQT